MKKRVVALCLFYNSTLCLWKYYYVTHCSDKRKTNLCGCNIHLFIERLTKRKQILSKRLILQHLQHKFFFIHHTHKAS